jgi:tetratricopeptide (TPR) repeat protein
LAPVIGIVQVGMQGMADRYTYVPLIGIFLLVIWGVTDVARAWCLPRYAVAAIAGTALACCVGLTWFQLAYWASDLALWTHAVKVTENNAGAHAALGICYYDKHADSLAIQEFQKALAIDPNHVVAIMNYGNALMAQRRPAEALTQYRRAVELTPDYPAARSYLGDALMAVGRPDEARAEYQALLELEPDSAVAHQKLGIVYARQGRQEEGLADYQKAVELEPKNPSFQLSLGEALLDLGRYEEAEASSRRALKLVVSGPDFA